MLLYLLIILVMQLTQNVVASDRGSCVDHFLKFEDCQKDPQLDRGSILPAVKLKYHASDKNISLGEAIIKIVPTLFYPLSCRYTASFSEAAYRYLPSAIAEQDLTGLEHILEHCTFEKVQKDKLESISYGELVDCNVVWNEKREKVVRLLIEKVGVDRLEDKLVNQYKPVDRLEDKGNSLPGAEPLLYSAIKNTRHSDFVKFLINQSQNVNSIDSQRSQTPLHALCASDIWKNFFSRKQKELALLLLEKGANVNARDKDGLTPFHYASQESCNDLIELFIERGADVAISSKDGDTALALYVASSCSEEPVVKLLLAKGANVNAQDKYGRTPLYHAALKCRNDFMQLFIERGADVNAQDKYGLTPFALYIQKFDAQKPAIELLLKEGADVNAQDKDGLTPLHYVSQQGRDKLMNLLIEKGADVAISSKDGGTALAFYLDRRDLYRFCNSGPTKHVVELLLNKGADVDAVRATDFCTPLHILCKHRCLIDIELIELLLKEGADVNAQDKDGNTPLHLASRNYDFGFPLVPILLKKPVELNAQNKDGNTALHLISEISSFSPIPSIKMIMKLIEHLADLNIKNNEGKTALHFFFKNIFYPSAAVREDRESVCQSMINILISSNVDWSIEDNTGETPLDCFLLNSSHPFYNLDNIGKFLQVSELKPQAGEKRGLQLRKALGAYRAEIRREPEKTEEKGKIIQTLIAVTLDKTEEIRKELREAGFSVY